MQQTRPTVFRNGHVFDGMHHRPGFGVVMGGGRVLAVVPDREIGRLASGGHEVDLDGGIVMPGFQDAHVHPVLGGLEMMRCDLSAVATREECLREVARYAASHQEVDWLRGGGWALALFGPRGPAVSDLDSVVPDRPAFLVSRDHHGAWVNSMALSLAGVDRNTPDPPDGRIERDARGNPTGALHEGAMSLVARHVPPTTSEEYYRALLVAQRYLHGFGVTAWQDALLGSYADSDDPSATYLRAADSGDLTARVRGALWWERDKGEEQVEDLLLRRETFTVGRLSAGAVKLMLDGVVERRTAAMSLPYLDGCGCRTGNTGLSFFDPVVLSNHVTRLDAEGFQVHVHAIGDRAVREALDSFDAALAANGPSRNRHHIAHIQVVSREDRARFARLGVTANMQPLWARLERQMVDQTIPYLAQEQVAWQYPFADLARAGARLAAGSDWPVTTPNPLLGVHVAVNRCGYAETGRSGTEVFLPEQRLSLTQAMAAYTSGSAYVNHLDESGLLEPGRLADVVVLDRDPFQVDPAEIGGCRVVATYVDGTPVFGA